LGNNFFTVHGIRFTVHGSRQETTGIVISSLETRNIGFQYCKPRFSKFPDLESISSSSPDDKTQQFKLPIHWLLIFISFFFVTDLSAQFPGSSRNPTGGRNPSSGFGGGSSNSSQKDPSRDTLSKEVFYYYADNAEDKKLFNDSSFINFHLYDPIRQGEYEYANLGNIGSAHRQIVYQQGFHKGFDAGLHYYDLYLTKPEDIRYYQLEKAFSDISFSQTSQEKTTFKADFSKPVGKQMVLNVRYRNIRNTGQYNNQAARANSFVPSLSFKSKNQKYSSYLSVIANTVEQKENGGLSFDATTISNVSKGLVAVGRPVNTTTGESRYFSSDVNYTQFYILEKIPKSNTSREDIEGDSLRNLVTKKPPINQDSIQIDTSQLNTTQPDTTQLDAIKVEQMVPPKDKPTDKVIPNKSAKGNLLTKRGIPPPTTGGRPTQRDNQPYLKQQTATYNQVDSDSSEQPATIKPTGRKYTLKHNLSIRKNTFKFTDTDTTAYQSDFRTDTRGVRSFIRTNQIENTFSIRTFKLEKEQASAFASNKKNNPKQKDLIEVGLTHTFTKLRQEGAADSTINNIFLFGNVQFTPSDRLKINAYGHLGIGQQAGDYYAKGDFLWDTKKLGTLNLSLIQQLRTPSLVNRRFYVTQNRVWQNDFSKTFENTLSGSYTIPKVNINLTANYHLIKNHIYFDNLAQPQQLDNDLNIFQLKVANQIDVWRFHLQNTVYFQSATGSDVIRFPQVYSIHRLYLDLKLFKVMESQFGGEIRVNTPWKPDNFSPLTGQFYLQDNFQRAVQTENGVVVADSENIPFYPFVDVFYNFRIKDFRFFLVAENVMHFVPVYKDFHYTTYPYPVADFQMRFGFRWLFLD